MHRGRLPGWVADRDDSIPEADHALFARRVLHQYALGKTQDAIAMEEDVDPFVIARIVREATEEVRTRNRQMCDETFLRQKMGLDHLIRRAMEDVERCCGDDVTIKSLPRDTLRILVNLYERQAKLLGLDKKVEPEANRGAWIQGATDDDLIRRAGELGIRLPSKFDSKDS